MVYLLKEYQAAIKTQVLKEYLMAWENVQHIMLHENVGYNS